MAEKMLAKTSDIVEVVPMIEQKHHSSLSTKLICGAVAGVIGTCIIYPLDIIKTRLQNQKKALPGSTSIHYNGGFDCFKKIVKHEGGRGLYQGISVNLIGIIPEKAIKLAVNDYMREHLVDNYNTKHNTSINVDNLPPHLGVIAGGTAGFCQVVATNPMEIVKIRMQLSALDPSIKTKPSFFTIAKEMGLRGLYKGTLATLCRDVPFSIMFFPSLAGLKQAFSNFDHKFFHPEDKGERKVPFWAVFAAGINAGIFAAALVTPMDVVKTRLQVVPKPGEPVYNNMLHCYKEIIKNEGPKALFKGVVPRSMIVAPLFAITVLVYEILSPLFPN